MNSRLDPADYLDSRQCGCDENSRSGGLSRRALLAGAGALGLAAGTAKMFGADTMSQYAYAGASYTGGIVVVMSMRGGFDGLSAVAPVGDPVYAKVRPTIGVPAARALKLDSTFGLHPALAPLKALWDRGQMSVVHAVGQPTATRSHFLAMEAMENAAPGSSLRTGWIDRMTGLSAADPIATMAVGAATTPRSMTGANPKLAIRTLPTFTLAGASSPTELTRLSTAIRVLQDGAPAVSTAAVNSTLDSLAQLVPLQATPYQPANGAAYPATDLSTAMKDLAAVIKSGVGLRTATVDFGNWDMHSGLGTVDSGWMFNQLTEFGKAIGAFTADLGTQMSKVTIVTLSEFGRRVAENGSGGLDHGHGNACFLIGGGVVGSKVFGSWPGLAAESLVDGDLAGRTDYRTILAELLEKRAQLSAADVFPGLGSDRLGAFTTV